MRLCIALSLLSTLIMGFGQDKSPEFTIEVKYDNRYISDTANVVQLDKWPKPIAIENPKYPESARKMGVEGWVTIRVLVDENGKVSDANIQKVGAGINSQSNWYKKASDKLKKEMPKQINTVTQVLIDSSLEVVKRWKFVPGELNGKAVKAWVVIPFKYKLDEGHKYGED